MGEGQRLPIRIYEIIVQIPASQHSILVPCFIWHVCYEHRNPVCYDNLVCFIKAVAEGAIHNVCVISWRGKCPSICEKVKRCIVGHVQIGAEIAAFIEADSTTAL